MNKEEIINFEDKIADLYKAGKIKSPIHLGGTNEDKLIEIFKNIKKDDWIFGTWRNHYQWLLSGRDPEKLKQLILDNHSMHVFDNKFFTSAIVGGIAPIALGVAWSLKRKKSKNIVWCFLGDMGASTGIAMESFRYACGHDLPIIFVVEDNGLSVRTDTLKSWGCKSCDLQCNANSIGQKIHRYTYERKWPHAGCGVFVLF